MKKMWKIFWIICAVIAGTGILMTVAGACIGGGESLRKFFQNEISEASHYWRDDDQDIDYDGSEVAEWTGEEQGYTDVKELDIDVTYVELEIISSDSSEVKVSVENLASELQDNLWIKKEGTELKIKSENRNIWKRFGKNDTGKLVVFLPKGQSLREVSVDVGAGSMRVEELQAENMNLEIGAGYAEIRNFKANNLDIECGTGMVMLTGSVSESVGMDCGVGNISYEDTGKYSDYNYDLEYGLGGITIHDEQYGGISGEKKIKNNAQKEMKIDCGLGNVNVSFQKGD